jgi:hypothetical protein
LSIIGANSCSQLQQHNNFLSQETFIATMSEDEADYAIESVDAGASAAIPMEAGQIKKGG